MLFRPLGVTGLLGGMIVIDPYWPFTDIPLPPFLWRPDLTGDYTNQGSDGAALNLTPAPGAPLGSFNQGWVIANPTQVGGGGESSVLFTPYNPDVSDLGSIFSIIVKGRYYNWASLFQSYNNDASQGMVIYWYPGAPFQFTINEGDPVNHIVKGGTTVWQPGTDYTLILTFNNGVVQAFINGLGDALQDLGIGSAGAVASVGDTGIPVFFGDNSGYPDSPTGNGSVFEAIGIAKGIAYTPDQVAEITAGLS